MLATWLRSVFALMWSRAAISWASSPSASSESTSSSRSVRLEIACLRLVLFFLARAGEAQ